MKRSAQAGLGLFAILIVAVALLGSVLIEMDRVSEGLWPTLRPKTLLARGPVRYDAYARLAAFPGKQQVDCPAQTPQTAVLLIAGQSNSANTQGQRFRAIGERVLNFYEGKCFLAESPLLGAAGELGESWTLLGDKLVAAGLFQRVILIPTGISGAPIRRWAAGGDLNRMIVEVIEGAAPFYKITHVLWHQGESDFPSGTTEAAYVADFQSFVGTLRAQKVSAPVYVSKASYGPTERLAPSADNIPRWTKENPIAAAQTKLPDGETIFAGPDTDADVSPLNRFDGMHFSGFGQEIFAERWLEILQRRPAPAPSGSP